MRIVLWIGDDSNQYALAQKIAAHNNVVGIVLETKTNVKRRKLKLRDYIDKAIIRFFFRSVAMTWIRLLKDYNSEYPELPSAKILRVNNINELQVKNFTESLNAELICVSGTLLIKKDNLRTNSEHGIINLHTGLSPYVKGGPNCTNWCIANNDFDLIGNTIMWIDEGIDSGNLLLTEQTQFSGKESFFEVHRKVMDHGHDLYLKAIDKIKSGEAKSIPQNSITEGKTYYSKEWTWREHWKLCRNFKCFNNLDEKKSQSPIVIS